MELPIDVKELLATSPQFYQTAQHDPEWLEDVEFKVYSHNHPDDKDDPYFDVYAMGTYRSSEHYFYIFHFLYENSRWTTLNYLDQERNGADTRPKEVRVWHDLIYRDLHRQFYMFVRRKALTGELREASNCQHMPTEVWNKMVSDLDTWRPFEPAQCLHTELKYEEMRQMPTRAEPA